MTVCAVFAAARQPSVVPQHNEKKPGFPGFFFVSAMASLDQVNAIDLFLRSARRFSR